MALIIESEIKDVHGISNEGKQRIIDFLQGAVYCWCKNRPLFAIILKKLQKTLR